MDTNMKQHPLLEEIENKRNELNQMIGEAILRQNKIWQSHIYEKSKELDNLTAQYLNIIE